MFTMMEIKSAMFNIRFNLEIIQVMRLSLACAGELTEDVSRAYDIAEKALSEAYFHLCKAINMCEVI